MEKNQNQNQDQTQNQNQTQNQLFRKKTLDKISSPEALHDYMRVTSPRLWMILSAIVVLLVGFVIYAATTRMESTEKVVIRLMDDRNGSCLVPPGREDLIKVGMEVRVEGRTGHVTQIDKRLEKILDVSFDRGPLTDSTYYIVSIGDSKDVQAFDENGMINPELIEVFQEEGYYFIQRDGNGSLLNLTENVRARFWTEEFNTDGTVTLVEGQPGTIRGIQQVIATTAFFELDVPDDTFESGKAYAGEIVTETTTPISFLLN